MNDIDRFLNQPPPASPGLRRVWENANLYLPVLRIQPYLVGQPHRWEHIGLASTCSCGWEKREFVSSWRAGIAWHEHAWHLIDHEAAEAEAVLQTLAKIRH